MKLPLICSPVSADCVGPDEEGGGMKEPVLVAAAGLSSDLSLPSPVL